MIIKNRLDHINIYIEGLGSAKKYTYTIKSLDTCMIVSQGNLPTLGDDINFDLKLPDGEYEISLSYQALPERFIVYYNGLHSLIGKFKKLICDCFTCKKDNDLSYKIMFDLMSWLSDTGLLCKIKSTEFLKETNKILSQQENAKRIFGNFTFDYKDKIITFFTLVYLELYYLEYESNPIDTEDINTIFNIDIIEKCLNNKGYDFNYLITLSKNYRCKECDCNN